MKKIAVAAAVALLVSGCAHSPQPQVNRIAKADKYTAPKKKVAAVPATPNQIVKKNWFPKYKIKWLHNK